LFGAIGHCLKHPVYATAESTNAIAYEKFLKDVVAAFRKPDDKPHLIADNHKAHFSPGAKELVAKHFTPTYIPTYSC